MKQMKSNLSLKLNKNILEIRNNERQEKRLSLKRRLRTDEDNNKQNVVQLLKMRIRQIREKESQYNYTKNIEIMDNKKQKLKKIMIRKRTTKLQKLYEDNKKIYMSIYQTKSNYKYTPYQSINHKQDSNHQNIRYHQTQHMPETSRKYSLLNHSKYHLHQIKQIKGSSKTTRQLCQLVNSILKQNHHPTN